MPYMNLNVTRKLTYDQKKALADGLGVAMTCIPGKLAEGLVLDIEDAKTFFLGGKEHEDCVFVKADYCGHFDFDTKFKFTVAVFAAIQGVLGTPYERMSMKLEENDNWCAFGDYAEVDVHGNLIPR
jgi:phenylpyruvate tautomerase PptA (4-oxalocrotonate tautomerase family)